MALGTSQEEVPDIAFPKRSKRKRLALGASSVNPGPKLVALSQFTWESAASLTGAL